MLDPLKHAGPVQKYLTFRAQLHDVIQQRSKGKKEKEPMQFDKGINKIQFELGNPVMLCQMNTAKLEAWRRGPFLIEGYGREQSVSYKPRQFNGRLFTPGQGHLADSTTDAVTPMQQTLVLRNESRGSTTTDLGFWAK